MMKLHLRLFLAVVLAAVPCAAYAAPLQTDPEREVRGFASDPDGAVAAARGRVAAGDLAGAIRELGTYVRAHPTEAAPRRLLGDLYYRQGNLAEAESAYLDLLKYFPDDRDAHNRLGAVYSAQNRIDEAIDQYNKSLPGSDSMADLVVLHKRKGDLAAFKSDLQRQEVALPADPELQDRLGMVEWVSHNYNGALRYFMRELDSVPDSLKGLNHLGMNYIDMQDYPRAFEAFTKCLRIDQSSYSCTVNLAAAKLETGDLAGAKSLLGRAEKLEPEHPEIMVNYGYLADKQGNWKEAVADYVKALAISPYSRDAYLNLGVDYEQHQLYALAESALLKGISTNPGDGKLHYLLGRTYLDQAKHDLALAQFRAAYACGDPDVTYLAQARLAQLGVPNPSPSAPH